MELSVLNKDTIEFRQAVRFLKSLGIDVIVTKLGSIDQLVIQIDDKDKVTERISLLSYASALENLSGVIGDIDPIDRIAELEEEKDRLILEAADKYGMKNTAEKLGVSRATLYRTLERIRNTL